jgi:1,4-alpha-glucan branching enzyme
VWSSIEGYPGDFDYREFYRDVGFDLDFEYIKPYIHKDGIRINTGIKYFRITGPAAEKEPYVLQRALDKAALHADNFLSNRRREVAALHDRMGRKPIVVAPYDAELFGHWWFEGPDWLNCLFRRIACDQDAIRLVQPSEYLSEYPVNQASVPSASSWGYQGYSNVWLNGANDWIYRHLHAAADRMEALADSFNQAEGLALRALNQAARELLLAQSSDWAFIMTRHTVVPYAVQRTKDHLFKFNRLYEMLKSPEPAVDDTWLTALDTQDNIFPNLDYRIYRGDFGAAIGIPPKHG